MEHIARPALNKGQIRLLTRVNRIDTRDSTVTIYTEDGTQFHCDEVVMTAPLGWLKLHKDTFLPPLPPRFARAVDAIGYGCLEKV
jgi:monoamine oxidase